MAAVAVSGAGRLPTNITAATGSDTLAHIEIEEGAYFVQSADQALPSEGRPINVHASSIVHGTPTMPPAAKGAKFAFRWGNPQEDQPRGTLLELPAGFTGMLRSHGTIFRAAVTQGRLEHRVPGLGLARASTRFRIREAWPGAVRWSLVGTFATIRASWAVDLQVGEIGSYLSRPWASS